MGTEFAIVRVFSPSPVSGVQCGQKCEFLAGFWEKGEHGGLGTQLSSHRSQQ